MLAADTLGTEFWFAFQQNGTNSGVQPTLYLTGPTATSGTVRIPGLTYEQSFTVTPGQITTLVLPSSALVSQDDGTANLGVEITSAEEIAVYGLNRKAYTTDAFVALPTDILGNEYLVMSYPSNSFAESKTQFAVVAVEDDTVITVTPTITVGTRTAGVPYQVTLQEGEVYQLANPTLNADLTGTSIESTKPVAVMSGNSATQIPVGTSYYDHIVEQLPPVVTWGVNFVTIPLAQRTAGDFFRVLASEEDTEVRVNGTLVATLDRGEFYETRLTTRSFVETSHPALVAQFATGRTYDYTTGDPLMALIPPAEQLLAEYTLTTPSSGFSYHYINIWAASQAVDSILVDGQPVDPLLFQPIGDSGFVGAQVPISAGTHNVVADSPIGVMIYGFTSDDSYGYTGGASLLPIGNIETVMLETVVGSTTGLEQELVATVLDENGVPFPGVLVEFKVTGANPFTAVAFTKLNGQASISYTGSVAGTDTITARAGAVTSNAATIEWTEPADLIPSQVVAPAYASHGQTIEVSWTVTNDGAGPAWSSWTDGIYFSRHDVFDGSARLLAEFPADDQVPLAGTGSYTRTESVELSWLSTQLGEYYLYVVADNQLALVESDELNNIAATVIDITRPDLIVDETPVVSTDPLVFGDEISLSWIVRNIGMVEASNFRLDRIWLSTDTTIGGGDYLLGSSDTSGFAPLGPDQTYSLSETFTLPLNETFTPGTYYVLVETNSSVSEVELDYTNNVTATLPLQITYPPLPDLVVSNLIIPPEVIAGQKALVSWTITNQGTTDFTGLFLDWLSFSQDDQIGSDSIYDGYDFTGTLAAGQSIVRTHEILFPEHWENDLYAIIETDGLDEVFEGLGENNNFLISGQAIDIIIPPYPNLLVGEVNAPLDAFSEQTIEVDWLVTNQGTGPTSAPRWYDEVYLSLDSTLDVGDIYLGRAANPAYLAVGDSYRNSLTVTLPRGIDDDYYILIKTDATLRVNERDSEGDNLGVSEVMTVQLSPPADLEVTNILSPTQVFSGQPFSVTWTVANNGTGPTRESSWNDRVYLSLDNVLDGSDHLLGSATHEGALAAGATYTVTAAGSVPLSTQGPFFVIVQTDTSNDVYEYTFEQNNIGVDNSQINVVLAPPPDLEVESVTAPDVVDAGHPMLIEFRVTNAGASRAVNSVWYDEVYLSTDSQFDPAGDTRLKTVAHYGGLDAGEGYDVSLTATLSHELTGEFYVYVITDRGDYVFELDNDNNLGFDPTPLTSTFTPADLEIVQFTGPGTVEAGQALSLDWIVRNSGIGETLSSNWVDRVLLSIDSTPSSDDLVLLTNTHYGTLDVDASYRVKDAFAQIPYSQLPGSYHLILLTDARSVVIEDDETNNASMAIPLEVSRIESDLEVAAVNALPNVDHKLFVEWTVQNNAPVITNSNIWYDEVYLSYDSRIDEGDLLLATVQHSNPLGPGETYNAFRQVSLPSDMSGNYFVIIRTDATDLVLEGLNENNNAKATSGGNSDGGGGGGDGGGGDDDGEGDLVIPTPLIPDLVVTEVDAPDTAYTGRDIEISWTVENHGDSTGNLSWTDGVYLSLDQVFDPLDDIYLVYANRPNALGMGESYQQTRTVQLPVGLAGPYYLFVVTDSSNRIYEKDAELNNRNFDPYSVEVLITQPVDFVVGTITVPATGIPGQQATVSYTVANLGENSAQGRWTDSVYLSADETWDVNDPLVGRVNVSGPVPSAGSYSETLTALLPGVVPGDYHIIIRSDILNQIPEGNEQNNIGFSLDSASIDFPALELGVPEAGIADADQSLYYQVAVPAGEALSFLLEGTTIDDGFELYVAYDRIPSRSNYDYALNSPFELTQRLIIPSSREGNYYVRLYRNTTSDSPANFTLTADLVEFDVYDSTFGTAGNSGSITLPVNGAKFDRTVGATLSNAVGVEITASQIYFEGSTLLYATFDLAGLAPGQYDLTLTKPGSSPVTVTEGLEVVPGVGLVTTLDILAPNAVIRNNQYSISYLWRNSGLNDVLPPLVALGNGVPIFDTTGLGLGLNHVILGVSEDGGPLNVLSPGSNGSFLTKATAPAAGGQSTAYADRLGEDLEETFNWELVKDSIVRRGIDDITFEAIFTQLISLVGNSWGDYRRMLAQNATRITAADGDPTDPRALLQLAFEDARASLGNSIRGTIYADSLDVIYGEVDVVATHIETGQQKIVTTRRDGSFAFTGLALGQYELTVRGAQLVQSPVQVEVFSDSSTPVTLEVFPGVIARGSIKGTNGLPLNDVRVTLIHSDGSVIVSSLTGKRGDVRIGGLVPGDYRVVAEAEGYTRTSATLTIDETSEFVELPTLRLAPEAKISFTVSLSDGVVAGDEFTAIARLNGDTSPDTTFAGTVDGSQVRFDSLPYGEYTIVVDQTGYVPVTLQNVIVSEGEELDLGNLQLVKGAEVSGVISNSSSHPNGHLQLELILSDEVVATTTPDENGNYRFVGAGPGTYDIRLALTDNAFASPVTVEVVDSTTVIADQLVIVAGATAMGFVRNTQGSLPVAGIRVQLQGDAGYEDTSFTDAQGKYQFEAIPEGSYSIVIPGVATQTNIQLAPGDAFTAAQDFTIDTSTRISGAVQTSAGSAAGGSSVLLLLADQVVATAIADEQGNYQFPVVTPGSYVLQVAGDGASQPVPVNVTSGTAAQVDLALGTRLIQASFDVQDVGITDTIVILSLQVEGRFVPIAPAMPDVDGNVTFDNLASGTYQLAAQSPDGGFTAKEVILTADTDVITTLNALEYNEIHGTIDSSVATTLENVQIILRDTTTNVHFHGKLNTDGTYSISSIPSGTYSLSFIAPGHAAVVIRDLVVAGEVVIDTTLNETQASVTGRVVDDQGNPLSGVSVVALDSDGNVVAAILTAEDGTFLIDSNTGPLTITLQGAGIEPVTSATPDEVLVELGDVEVQTVAIGANLSDTVEEANNSLPPPVIEGELTANFIGGYLDSAFNWVRHKVDNFRRDDEASDNDLVAKPDCDDCEPLRDLAMDAIADQQRAYQLADQEQSEAWDSAASFGVALGKDLIEIGSFAVTALKAFKLVKGLQKVDPGCLKGIGLSVIRFNSQIKGLREAATDARSARSEGDALAGLHNAGQFMTEIFGVVNQIKIVILSCVGGGKYDDALGFFQKYGTVVAAIDQLLGIRDALDFSPTIDAFSKMQQEFREFEKAEQDYLRAVDKAISSVDSYNDCVKNLQDEEDNDDEDVQDELCNGPCDTEKETDFPASRDPNDIIGPSGFGPEHWIAASDPLNYRIRFENDPLLATAPAQSVRIVQQLDTDLDFRSFRLGDFAIGNLLFEVPDNRSFHSDRLDLTQELGVYVDVFAGIDIVNGEAFWELQAIDPATGEPPQDPLVGLLPPNLTSPEGEGFFDYTIGAKSDVVTGTVIDAVAEIVFDINEPILTPAIFNTLDADGPTSSMTQVPSTVDSATFLLSWSGLDVPGGSGLATFDIFVSENGGAYQPLLVGTTLTQYTFTGVRGNEYQFFSLARDNAGNIQSPTGNSDFTTQIVDNSIPTGTEALVLSVVREDETSPVGTQQANMPPGNTTLNEWENGVAQLWLEVTAELQSQPITLTFDIEWNSQWFTELESLANLAAQTDIQITEELGMLHASITLAGIDLSSYMPGQKVLISSLLLKTNQDDAAGLLIDTDGHYPQATTSHGLKLLIAEIWGGDNSLRTHTQVVAQIAPVVYDFNEDGRVGLADFAGFISKYGRQVDPEDSDTFLFDYDRNGRVSIADFALFIRHYGLKKPNGVRVDMPGFSASESPAETSNLPLEGESLAEHSMIVEREDQGSEMIMITPNFLTIVDDLNGNERIYRRAERIPMEVSAEGTVSSELDGRLVDAVSQDDDAWSWYCETFDDESDENVLWTLLPPDDLAPWE